MKSMEEAGRRGSAGEVLRQRQAEKQVSGVMEEKEDPWTTTCEDQSWATNV